MAFSSVRCPVLDAQVTRVTDFEGTVTRIICAEYDESSGNCRLKKTVLEGGPLAQLLERMAQDALDTRRTLCVLRAT